jgi:preprotein translocase subunit SecD
MARTQARPNHALRTLICMLVATLALGGLLVGAHLGGTASLAPKLGLDLEGGTQLVLTPRVVGDQKVTAAQVAQARDIISERVDSQGVTGAEVTTQGENNIVVSMAGDPSREQEENLRQSSALQFRPVLVAQPSAAAPTPTDTATTPSGSSTSGSETSGTGTSSGTATSGSGTTTKAESASSDSASRASDSSTSASRSRERSALPAASATSGTSSDTATSSTDSASESSSSGVATPSGTPTSPTDQAWITEALTAEFTKLDCANAEALANVVDDPAKPLVTCSSDGAEKFILGPVAVYGKDITDAVAGYKPGPERSADPRGRDPAHFRLRRDQDVCRSEHRDARPAEPAQPPRLDSGLARDRRPQFNEAITGGRSSITGGFTYDSAQELAKQLKFGAAADLLRPSDTHPDQPDPG